MELIIEIPNAMYEDIKSGKDGYSNYVHTAIRNGTPLPKGHGRLIDADKAIREENSKLVDFETTDTIDRSYCRYARMILNDTPTIIEAESEE